MTKDTYKKFKNSLAELLKGQSKAAVAVSGGSDSMALALLFGEYALESKIEIIALTVDHGLRAESAEEANKVNKWLTSHGIEHHTLLWEGKKKPSNIQAEARKARYKLMSDFCLTHNIKSLMVAHTLNDQAETVLMRLMRGSGVDGLSGIVEAKNIFGINIVRPLLNFTRDELRDYLCIKKQEWIEDPSNENTKFKRVQVRNLIKENLEPELLIKRLADTASHMARTRDYIEERMAERLSGVTIFHNEGFYSIDIERFKSLHNEERLRFLAKALQRVGGQEYKPRFENLKALHNNIMEGNINNCCTLSGCAVTTSKKQREGNYLFIYREQAAVEADVDISTDSKIMWDRRFECSLNISNTNSLKVGALGNEGYNTLSKNGFKISLRKEGQDFLIPKKVIHSLPALKNLDNQILAVPHIGYYSNEELRNGFAVHSI